MEERLLSLAEALEFLGISKPTLYRMIRDKSIVAYKVRGRWRFREKDLQDYVVSRSNVVTKQNDN